MIMVMAKYSFDTIRALFPSKLGTYPNSFGWTYEGKPIVSVELARSKVVRLIGPDSVPVAVFQDFVYLDD